MSVMTTWRSDLYHRLAMCHVYVSVIVSSRYQCVCLLLDILKLSFKTTHIHTCTFFCECVRDVYFPYIRIVLSIQICHCTLVISVLSHVPQLPPHIYCSYWCIIAIVSSCCCEHKNNIWCTVQEVQLVIQFCLLS
jgi:hypothetical protein